ncbi:MAG: dTDP-4-dehydrorhamnose 3,5-epimerase family protein [Acidobacteria bacterium]|nr:dTDP-4-dehydrorhamnose 3,5-epimerase family protein [Acidobacteriota bacterium]
MKDYLFGKVQGRDRLATVSRTEWRPVAQAGDLQLGIIRNGTKGLGVFVDSPDSPELIAEVQLAPIVVRPDDRGYFLELFRWGQGLAQGPMVRDHWQVSAALSYPGTIKAFHYHLRQTDLWTPVRGQLQVMLYDLRVHSPSFGKRNTIYTGILRPWQIRIPPGVAHGYKVIGTEPALLVYATDHYYDPTDEGRLAWNDPDINYDWETQRK